MKKTNAMILGMAALAVLPLASCGGGNNQGVDGKYNVSISARKGTTEKGMLEIWKAGYEKLHPEVNIIIDTWGSIESSEGYIKQNALNRSQITDMLYTTDDTTAYLAEKNNFVDLRPFFEASADTDYSLYYESMLNLTSLNGEFRPTTNYNGAYASEKSDDKAYGVYFCPREYNMPGLLLNLDLFAELGVNVPTKDKWNWDAFVALLQEISNKIQEKVDAGLNKYNVYRGIELHQTWEPVYCSIMKELGGDGFFTVDPKSMDIVPNVTSSGNMEAFNAVYKAFGESKYKYAIDQDLSNEDFVGNSVFMTAISYPEVADFNQSVKNISFMPFPTEYVSAGCGGYAILRDRLDDVITVNGVSKKKVDICWDFLKYTISEEGQNAAGLQGYVQPVLKSLEKDGDWTKSIDPKLDHSAFAAGKELTLNTFTFAPSKSRGALRDDVSALFRSIFATNAEEDTVNSAVNKAMTDLKRDLAA